MSYREAQPILLVEDSDDDAELTELAFAEAMIANPLVRVRDGDEASDWLLARGRFGQRSVKDLPAIVLLDLNLPGASGLEVLEEIRRHEVTKCLPVVILTTSIEESDRTSAYDRHANSYVQKPVDHDDFVAAIRHLGLYWTVTNEPPPSGA